MEGQIWWGTDQEVGHAPAGGARPRWCSIGQEVGHGPGGGARPRRCGSGQQGTHVCTSKGHICPMHITPCALHARRELMGLLHPAPAARLWTCGLGRMEHGVPDPLPGTVHTHACVPHACAPTCGAGQRSAVQLECPGRPELTAMKMSVPLLMETPDSALENPTASSTQQETPLSIQSSATNNGTAPNGAGPAVAMSPGCMASDMLQDGDGHQQGWAPSCVCTWPRVRL